MHLKLHLEDGFVANFDFCAIEQTSGIGHNENARHGPYMFLVLCPNKRDGSILTHRLYLEKARINWNSICKSTYVIVRFLLGSELDRTGQRSVFRTNSSPL
jgi:hypothetical protein